MKACGWIVPALLALILTSQAWAQPLAPQASVLLAPPGSPTAVEGAALAAQAEQMLKEGGDAKAPGAMILAERGADLGDAKAYALVTVIYFRTGVRPKQFPEYIGRFLRLNDDLPLNDPLAGHSMLMHGIVKHGDTAVVENLLGPAIAKGDASAMFHLGMLRFVSGQHAQARALLERSAAAGDQRAARMIDRLSDAANQRAKELPQGNAAGPAKP